MATTTSDMVVKLREAAASNIGVVSINIDGRIIVFNRQQLLSELDYWERKSAKENNTRSIFIPVRLG
jgi:hypothetical protein